MKCDVSCICDSNPNDWIFVCLQYGVCGACFHIPHVHTLVFGRGQKITTTGRECNTKHKILKSSRERSEETKVRWEKGKRNVCWQDTKQEKIKWQRNLRNGAHTLWPGVIVILQSPRASPGASCHNLIVLSSEQEATARPASNKASHKQRRSCQH